MSFNTLRINRTLQTLKGWINQQIHPIEHINVKHGDFTCPKEARENHGFTKQSLPWLITTENTRYWICFDTTLPKFDPDYEYMVEFSTGREGAWDAVNPQLLAYLNGEIVCGLDVNHRTIYIDSNLSGQSISVDLHMYTGMQPGDTLFRAKILRRHRLLNKVHYDLKVAYDAMLVQPSASEPRSYLEKHLLKAVYDLLLEDKTAPSLKVQLEACHIYLMEKVYGVTSLEANHTVHAIGHTHIDVAWLWDLKQTREKVTRSFATALDLQNRYPNYKFMASQPILYEMLNEVAPSVFNRVKKSAEEGLWEAEGAMYLEADCNLISGESMIRQIELGNAYFTENFGAPSRTLWLPDVFGYSAAMPQVLKGFDIELFITSKISWSEYNKLPYDSFVWEGIDGSRMPTQFITTIAMDQLESGQFKTIYEGNFTASEVRGSVMRHQQKDLQPHTVMPYGYGDGGGGATEEMLETALRLERGLPGMPTVSMSHISDFVRGFKQTDVNDLPIWCGELYLEYHRGTYTTNSGIKQRHRRLEDLLLHTERLQTIAKVHGIHTVDSLEAQWRILLLNQFHDILPGTSIEKVYKDAYEQLDEAIDSVRSIQASLTKTMASQLTLGTNQVCVINTHGHTFEGIIYLSNQVDASTSYLRYEDADYPIQQLDNGDRLVYLSNIPALSAVILTGYTCQQKKEQRIFDELSFETPHYNVVLNAYGAIESLFDKTFERDVIKPGGLGNHVVCYDDRPLRWDAWDINIDYLKYAYDMPKASEIRVINTGSVTKEIKVVRQFKKSTIEQLITFYEDSRRIDFETTVDWHEEQTLLRTSFDVNVHATEAKYDIQFGHVKRPTNFNHSYNEAMFEVCAAHWGDLSEDDYGVALISNDKFGYSALDTSISMSLIKSPTWPNPVSDQGYHHFTYSLLPHGGDAIRGEVHQQAMNQAVVPIVIGNVQGSNTTTEKLEFMTGCSENLQIESLRVLDAQTIELRLVEHYNRRGQATLQFIKNFSQVNLVQLNGKIVDTLAKNTNKVTIFYKPFEIITLRLSL